MSAQAGFREVEHTADWELEVWAADLPALLEQAARGMYALSGVHLGQVPAKPRRLVLPAGDPEKLLVSFLSELLYLQERDGLVFTSFNLVIEEDRLLAEIQGVPLAGLGKEIKAVTYHNLNLRQTQRGIEARIVFDV